MDDVLNTYETQLVNLLQGDGGYPSNDISDNVESTNIHVKLKEDLRQYYSHNLPAIGVMTFSYTETAGMDEIGAKIQVVHMGGDLATIDGLVKTIVMQIVKVLKDESPRNKEYCLLNNADAIKDISANIIYGQLDDEDNDIQLIVCIGEIDFKINLIEI